MDRLGGGSADLDGFADALSEAAKDINDKQAATKSVASTSSLAPSAGFRNSAAKLSPYGELEAFVLQQFVETILPHNDSLYGGKIAGGMWRSMMAEQMARNIARGGGIGLARRLEAAAAAKAQASEKVSAL
jgi:flagellar protein FlgJ